MADAEQSVAVAASLLGDVLAHPLRVQILEQLTKGPGSAKTISDTLGIELGNVSYHLNEVLFKKCQVIAEEEKVQRRGAKETVYRLDYDRLLNLAREASAFFASFFAGLAAGSGEDGDPGDAKTGNGLAALRLGSLSASTWKEVTAALAEADGRVASEVQGHRGGRGIQAIFGVAALRLPAAPGAS
jgi:DNA-binding transcriptional ArsR family regulator